MTKAKVEAKDITALTFFECQNIIDRITEIAAENEGVVSDEHIEALVEAQTQAPAKLKSLVNFLRLMESKIDLCKQKKKDIR
jgi:hypothetical protein